MIYMWFTGINYYKLAVEKDRESIFTTMHYDHIETRFMHVNQRTLKGLER
jgi:hypothetical protein